MRTTLLFCILFFASRLFPQEISWAKKIPTPAYIPSKGLLSDNTGNLYNYGSYYQGYYGNSQSTFSDTLGTYLQKFNAQGDLQYSKQWKSPFYITKMIYDGGSSFYFSGAFRGIQNIDGNLIASKGGYDGMVGKMDLNGTVIWLRSFGGSQIDNALGICFNLSKNKLIVTGGIYDSLFVNHSYKASGNKPMLIATYDLNGTFENYKLYDFDAVRDFKNCGNEIVCDKEGNYLVLADRDGQHWNDPMLTDVPEGRYVFKLNSNLDTLWSRFIISSGCYYGWSCSSLSLADNGDAFIPSYCSSKYGGQGRIYRLDKTNGKIIWTHNNKDGAYSETFTNGTSFYSIGTEGADIYPGQGTHGGYEVVKKYGASNNLLGEARLRDGHITNITMNNAGTIFVQGYFTGRTAIIGNTTLIADSFIYYQNYYNYRGNFIIAFNNKDCMSPDINADNFHPFPTYFCPSSSIAMDAGSGYSSYLWSNGLTTQSISPNQTGSYWVQVSQPSGCKAYSLPFQIIAKTNDKPLDVCLSTFDLTSKKNKIQWYANYDTYGTDYYRIYKETSPNVFSLIDTLDYDWQSWKEFTDHSSNPGPNSGAYYVTLVDTCGNESPRSELHQPMYLSLQKNGGTNKLTWNSFRGFPFSKYYIYRGISESKLVLIDSISSASTEYSDPFASQNYYYQVKVKKQYGCWINQTNVDVSFSNIVPEGLTTSTDDIGKNPLTRISVYPNPSNGNITVEINSTETQNVQITARNILGQTIISKNFKVTDESLNANIDLSKEAKGLYFIEITSGKEKELKRIVVN
jgi:hypothetical protein